MEKIIESVITKCSQCPNLTITEKKDFFCILSELIIDENDIGTIQSWCELKNAVPKEPDIGLVE
ncbi:MAG: hypothetical protein ACOC56_00185 [Atribacterota bacterium]